MRTLGVANTKAVIDLYRKAAADPVTAFVFGKSYDVVKAQLGDKAKSIVGRLVQSTVSKTTSALPLNRDKQLTGQLKLQMLHLQEFCNAVGSDRNVSGRMKEQCFTEVRQSPFMQAPRTMLDESKLAPKIELGFYMQMILDSDYLRRHAPPDMRMPTSRAGGIDDLPSSAKYPKSQRFTDTLGYYNTVEIDRPGGHIQAAIDRLHLKLFAKPFYAGVAIGGVRIGGDKAGELRKAEDVARTLSKLTRPTTIKAVVA